MQPSSRPARLRSRLAGLRLAIRLLSWSARVVWALTHRPNGLSRVQWRAVRRAAHADARRGEHGASRPTLLAAAPDLATKIALASAFWGCRGVESPFAGD
jgi:hypothetical protein